MRDLSRAGRVRQPKLCKCNSQFSVHFLIKAANIPYARVTPNLLTVLPHWRCTLRSLYTTYDTSTALRVDRLDRLDIDVHARVHTHKKARVRNRSIGVSTRHAAELPFAPSTTLKFPVEPIPRDVESIQDE